MAWTEWRDRAACVGEDPELFFPIGTGQRAALQIDRAKEICRGCRVLIQCADFAISNGYEGVWGGLDDSERRRVRSRRVVRSCHRRETGPEHGSAAASG